MANTITIDLSGVSSKLGPTFQPFMQQVLDWLKTKTVAEKDAWVALAQSDEDAAKAQLLAGMTETALTAQMEADGAQFDADVAKNAIDVAAQKAFVDKFFSAIIMLAAGAVTL